MSYAAIEIKILQWSEARKIIPNSNPEYGNSIRSD